MMNGLNVERLKKLNERQTLSHGKVYTVLVCGSIV